MSDKQTPPDPELEADTETAGPHPVEVVTGRDELGRPSETVAVADPEAASHWNADLWRPL